MKLNLQKKNLKSLSSDAKALPNQATPQVAGGTLEYSSPMRCRPTDAFNGCPTGRGCFSTPNMACIDPEL